MWDPPAAGLKNRPTMRGSKCGALGGLDKPYFFHLHFAASFEAKI
jgi:hypothetical protein